MKLQLKIVGENLFKTISKSISYGDFSLPEKFFNEHINWSVVYLSPDSGIENFTSINESNNVILLDGHDDSAIKFLERLEHQIRLLRKEKYQKISAAAPVIVLFQKNKTDIWNFSGIVVDWIYPPIDSIELANRIFFRLNLNQSLKKILQFGGVKLLSDTHQVKYEDRFINLSPSEFFLLEFLLMRMGGVASLKDLEELFQSIGRSSRSNNIRVTTFQLRLKLEMLTKSRVTISCVRSKGYCLRQKFVPGDAMSKTNKLLGGIYKTN